MSQKLTPVNNGIAQVQTTVSVSRPLILSDNSIKLRKLEPQLTEWRPEGRPIYHRLPSASERYQIDFFEEKGEGYVYIPYGEGIFGPRSLEVVASENNETIIIKPGAIVWEYGESIVNPAVINCRLVGLGSTRYLLGYQMYYDDAPFDAQYAVEDYNLSGYPLDISASTDQIVGWKYPAVNAFIAQSEDTWRTRDNSLPTYAQPSQSWLSWSSMKKMALSQVKLRSPAGTLSSGSAVLYLKSEEGGEWVENLETSASLDEEGYFYEFNLDDPTFQYGFKVMWSDPNIVVQSITVSGIITLTSRPATLRTQGALVAYPENMVPDTFTNSQGEEVPVSICRLAYVDVSDDYVIQKIDDVRKIVYRDYKPVAEWLTRPQDEDLISLFEEVSDYANLWMSPTNAVKHEYRDLETDSVEVVTPSH